MVSIWIKVILSSCNRMTKVPERDDLAWPYYWGALSREASWKARILGRRLRETLGNFEQESELKSYVLERLAWLSCRREDGRQRLFLQYIHSSHSSFFKVVHWLCET